MLTLRSPSLLPPSACLPLPPLGHLRLCPTPAHLCQDEGHWQPRTLTWPLRVSIPCQIQEKKRSTNFLSRTDYCCNHLEQQNSEHTYTAWRTACHVVLGILLVVSERPGVEEEVVHATPATPRAATRWAPAQFQASQRRPWEAPHVVTHPRRCRGSRELAAPCGVPPRHRRAQHLPHPLPVRVCSVGKQKLRIQVIQNFR